MKKQLLCCLAVYFGTDSNSSTQSFNEERPGSEFCKLSMVHTNYFVYASVDEAKAGIKENSTNFMNPLKRSVKLTGKTCRCNESTDFYQTINDKG